MGMKKWKLLENVNFPIKSLNYGKKLEKNSMWPMFRPNLCATWHALALCLVAMRPNFNPT